MTAPSTRRATLASLACAAAGTLGLVVGFAVDRRQAFFSYLAAFTYATTVALGALVFLQIVHAMGATWPVTVRRLVEAIAGTLPLLALLFLPVLAGLTTLYPWSRPEAIADEHVRAAVMTKRAYLDTGGFVARAALYFAVWIGTAFWLRRDSRLQDADPSAPLAPRMRAVAAATLPATGLAFTFAAFDWWMSLTPAWASTMFGIYVFAAGFITALALVTLLAAIGARAGELPIGPSHFYALGRLLLAFVIFWAYAAFFQFFLIWIANEPEEVPYYVTRAHGSWLHASVALLVTHFGVPFFALLPYRPKRRGGYLAAVSIWLLAAHWLDVHWLVMPAAHPEGFSVHWLDLAAYLAVSGGVTALGLRIASGLRLVPVNDPALEAAIRYEST
jgi:hypothetical protein